MHLLVIGGEPAIDKLGRTFFEKLWNPANPLSGANFRVDLDLADTGSPVRLFD